VLFGVLVGPGVREGCAIRVAVAVGVSVSVSVDVGVDVFVGVGNGVLVNVGDGGLGSAVANAARFLVGLGETTTTGGCVDSRATGCAGPEQEMSTQAKPAVTPPFTAHRIAVTSPPFQFDTYTSNAKVDTQPLTASRNNVFTIYTFDVKSR
jgi:hypothetical protein